MFGMFHRSAEFAAVIASIFLWQSKVLSARTVDRTMTELECIVDDILWHVVHC